MAVLPASGWINFDRFKRLVGTQNVELATEQQFEDTFPDCEVGAMPPFGNLYGMDVYADTALADDEQIAFNAGSHTELIQLPFEDFQRLVKPKVVGLTYAD
jgi:Ala-tRNA(Pro) deacylase